jgi:hypothetical protein
VLLLTRLGDLNVEISDVVVDSLTVKDLTRADRRLKLSGRKYPLEMAGEDAEQLRKAFHTAASKVGRPSGAKGGGNGTKKLRIYVVDADLYGFSADELEDKLAGKGSK